MENIHNSFLAAAAMLITISTFANAQLYRVRGNVSVSGTGVKYALVTFTDDDNSAVQYTALTDTSGNYDLGSITLVRGGSNLPTSFRLDQNYPNPFSASTSISYELDKQSDVKISIYDILGRKVRDFSAGLEAAGSHGVVWDGRNNFGERVAAGVYFYRLQARGEAQTRKLVFGMGEAGTPISLSGFLPSTARGPSSGFQATSGAETFTVTIGNTDSTSPEIAAAQFNSVIVESDTTLDYPATATFNTIVYMDSTQQIIRGFGGANIVGWNPGLNYGDMTPAQIQTAFGNGPGQLGFSIMRLRIPPDSTQFTINVASTKLANSLGAKVIATPWTPPAWMKTNDNTIGGSLDTNDYAAFAAHLKAFADTMADEGAPVYAVSVQNEPDYVPSSYEGCGWNATQMLNFMKYDAPAVNYPVLMPESASFNQGLSDPTLNDSVAASHVAFIGGHLYGATPAIYPLALSEGKEVWMTEYLINGTTNGVNLDTTWTGALMTAKSINDCMNANMSAYVWWFIVRYYGPIDDGKTGGVAGSITRKGYVMMQYSKFIRPGYHRVTSTANPLPNVFVTAYRDSAKAVIVILNENSSSSRLAFDLNDGTATSFTPYVTSATKNFVPGNDIPVSGEYFNVTVDASSVTTLVSK